MTGTTPIRPDALVFGIGNSGRSDDGLGWAFLDRLRSMDRFQGRAEYRYQLQVEDADLVAEADQVVFVDAFHGKLPGGIRWKACEPAADFQFSTHALPPRAVMSLCRDLYPRTPPAVMLMIEGAAWDLQTGLSAVAKSNLELALDSFQASLGTTHTPGRSAPGMTPPKTGSFPC